MWKRALASLSLPASLWPVPGILAASMLLAWGAEAAQFFIAQGFALAILAWMQTLPEFAVEAILAWKQQTPLMLAGLTGALRLLSGLGWPLIYLTAAISHRRRTGSPLCQIQLDSHHRIEIAALGAALLYCGVIWWKRSLHLWDALVLIAIYAGYLWLLTRVPPESHEEIEDLPAISRAIVQAPRAIRNLSIAACFALGAAIIYFTADPFLQTLIGFAAVLGIPSFVIIQWLAPVISEAPEMLSTFYFARQQSKASMALMNIVSSNINQLTMLMALLPIVLSISRHSVSGFALTGAQADELLLTIVQTAIAMLFLLNMQLAWWEAVALFILFALQFLPAVNHQWLTAAFGLWAMLLLIVWLVKRFRS